MKKTKPTKTIQIRDVAIGSGMPKICVSVSGKTKAAVIDAAKVLAKMPAVDIVEWRADYFDDILELTKTEEILRELKDALCGKPLIFTFRTLAEGGCAPVSLEQYLELNCFVAKSGNADLIDIEFFCGANCKIDDKNIIGKMVKHIHACGGKVLLSNHDFGRTPPKDEIADRFKKMTESGADIAKIAVMPTCKEDVFSLMSAAAAADKTEQIPLIAISMGQEGNISRFAGEVFGSAVTFGALGANVVQAHDLDVASASAPGQIEIEELRNILELIHNQYKGTED